MKQLLINDIHEMVWLMDTHADKILKQEFAVSYRKFFVLAVLEKLESSSQHQLATRLSMSDAAVSKSVRELERQGLAFAIVDPAHARRKIVRLTHQGSQLVSRMQLRLEDIYRGLLAGIAIDAKSYGIMTLTIRNALKLNIIGL